MRRAPFAHIAVLIAFIFNSFGPIPTAQAQDFVLPKPGVMVHLSPAFNPPVLKGIKVHPDNPFRFDFILDKGDGLSSPNASNGDPNQEQLKTESTKLIKYFLASLTIPEKDLWVNLSPYEKDRIVPESFGQTEMGRDLLAQDYMLKQITASLIYPEDEIGQKFWKRIYEEAQKKYGNTNIPVNTFNKVWIVPEKAVVYENAQAGTAYVVESKLKVMLEQDYLALEKNTAVIPAQAGIQNKNDVNAIGSQIVREIVIPELTTEVNEGKNFAQLRQVYNSLILATWYKKKIKDSILSQVYADKNKVAGVNIDDPQEKQKIYQQYLQAFKKGAYNYIKEELDPISQQAVPRKYFSGGWVGAHLWDATTQVENDATASATTRRFLDYDSRKSLAMITSQVYAELSRDVGLSDDSGGDELKKTLRRNMLNAIGRMSPKMTGGAHEGSDPALSLDKVTASPHELAREIQNVLEYFQIDRTVYLFGSSARYGLRSDHDVDIAVGDGQDELIPMKRRNMLRGDHLRETICDALMMRFRKRGVFNKHVDYFELSYLQSLDDSFRHGVVFRITQVAIEVMEDKDIFLGRLSKDARFVSQKLWSMPFLPAMNTVDIATNGSIEPPSIAFSELSEAESARIYKTYSSRFGKVSTFAWEGDSLGWARLSFGEKGGVINETEATYCNYIVLYDKQNGQAVLIHAENYQIPELTKTAIGKAVEKLKEAHRDAEIVAGIFSPKEYPERSSKIAGFYRAELDRLMIPRSEVDSNSGWGLESDVKFVVDEGVLLSIGSGGRIRRAVRLGVVDKVIKTNALAEVKKSETGGIDLTPDNMNLETQNNNGEIKFKIDPAMLEQLRNAPGFTPVIINIQPLTNLREFLGLSAQEPAAVASG